MIVCEKTVYIPFASANYLMFLSFMIFLFGLLGFYVSDTKNIAYVFLIIVSLSFTIFSILLINSIFA